MRSQIDRELYGLEWPSDPKKAPLLNIPRHLQRTVMGLQLLHEHAVERRKDTERVVLENAISAIAWMAEQVADVIDAVDQITALTIGNGYVSSFEELLRKVKEG